MQFYDMTEGFAKRGSRIFYVYRKYDAKIKISIIIAIFVHFPRENFYY